MQLDNERETIVVTGGNSGIGYALVNALLADGRTVVAFDRTTDRLATIGHSQLHFQKVDVTNEADVEAAFAGYAAWTRVVGFVACAAVFERRGFLDLTEALWDETFAVNLTGTLFGCRAVLPLMRAAGCGSIVLLSSSLARTGSAGGGHYAATKGAILGLGRSLALEVAAQGIRVNVVSPGLIDTPQPRAHAGGAAAMMERAKSIPLGRIGQPEDVVQAILFLLSEDASYVTGQDIRVNGGSQVS